MTVEWVVKILGQRGQVGLFADPALYYSESGWQSDITHATSFHSKEEAEKVAFSIVTSDPTKVGCVSVEEDSA